MIHCCMCQQHMSLVRHLHLHMMHQQDMRDMSMRLLLNRSLWGMVHMMWLDLQSMCQLRM